MIRLIVLLIIAVLFLVLTLPVVGVLTLIGRKDPEKKRRGSQRMVQWIFRVLLFFGGVRVTKRGMEHLDELPDGTGVLYAGNHRSIFDIVVVYAYLPGTVGIIAKDSLKKVPLLAMWMRNVGCLFLDRNDIKAGLRMIQEASEQMKNGNSILIYPEGTRNKGENDLPLMEFHEGSFRMATKTGCPVVPVAVAHTADIFEKHKPFVRAANVTLSFGKPIDTAALSRDEKKRIGAYTREVITGMLEDAD